jgi:hypothetical protein
MAHTACLVCFISAVNGHCNKKEKEKKKLTLGRLALVAGTQQILSNLFWRLSISMVQTNNTNMPPNQKSKQKEEELTYLYKHWFH